MNISKYLYDYVPHPVLPHRVFIETDHRKVRDGTIDAISSGGGRMPTGFDYVTLSTWSHRTGGNQDIPVITDG